MVSIIPITCIILFLIKMVKYASKCHQQKYVPALFPIEHLYMTVDIFDIQLLNTMCHQRIHVFLSFRFALREPDSIYISKKRTSTFGYFQTLFSFYCFNWVNLLFYEFTFAPNNNLAQNVFFKESSNLMCTIQITKCSLQNI